MKTHKFTVTIQAYLSKQIIVVCDDPFEAHEQGQMEVENLCNDKSLIKEYTVGYKCENGPAEGANHETR